MTTALSFLPSQIKGVVEEQCNKLPAAIVDGCKSGAAEAETKAKAATKEMCSGVISALLSSANTSCADGAKTVTAVIEKGGTTCTEAAGSLPSAIGDIVKDACKNATDTANTGVGALCGKVIDGASKALASACGSLSAAAIDSAAQHELDSVAQQELTTRGSEINNHRRHLLTYTTAEVALLRPIGWCRLWGLAWRPRMVCVGYGGQPGVLSAWAVHT